MPTPIQSLIGAVDTALGVAEDVGRFLAAPAPSNSLGAGVHSAGRQACRSWANSPAWAQALPSSGYFGMQRACSPYLGDNGWDDPIPGDGVDGAQCETLYRVSGSFEVKDADGNVTPLVNFGPVNALGPISRVSGTRPTGRPFVELQNRFGSRVTSADTAEGNSIRVDFTATPVDGSADDCGNNNPTTPGLNPPPDPGLDGPNAPRLGPDGGLRIPVPPAPNPFGGAPINLPDIVINPPGAGDAPTDPPLDDPLVPDGPTPPAGDQDAPPPTDPPTDLIYGVVVFISEIVNPSPSIIFQSTAPDIYAPRLANVSFEMIVGDTTAWTSDINCKNRRNVIFTPGGYPAASVNVTFLGGVTGTYVTLGKPVSDSE